VASKIDKLVGGNLLKWLVRWWIGWTVSLVVVFWLCRHCAGFYIASHNHCKFCDYRFFQLLLLPLFLLQEVHQFYKYCLCFDVSKYNLIEYDNIWWSRLSCSYTNIFEPKVIHYNNFSRRRVSVKCINILEFWDNFTVL